MRSIENRKTRLLGLGLLAALAACQNNDAPSPSGATAAPDAGAGEKTAAAAATPAAAAQPQVAIGAMDADQLRKAAITALSENRLYSPVGNNAIEFYLALRDKLPDDFNVSSALTDLAPYTAIAIEQNLSRGEFDEASRMTGLIEKIDPKYPALTRLKQNIASAQETFARRQADEQARLAAQQKKQAQQQAEQVADAAKPAPAAAAPAQQQAKPVAAAPKPVETPVEQAPVVAAPVAAAPVAKAPTAADLRLISAPPPRYPPEAFRNGTSGEVLLEITVGTDGSVSEAHVIRSVPARIFDREALTAVRRWKFAPIDAPVTMRKTINFKPS